MQRYLPKLPAWAAILVLGAGSITAAPKSNIQVHEGGFGVTHFDECGYQGPAPRGRPQLRPPRGVILDIECSPGGAWGPFAYLAVSALNQDFDPVAVLERVGFDGSSELVYQEIPPSRATFLSFAPPGWRDGDRLFLTIETGSGGILGIVGIHGFTPALDRDAYALRLSYTLLAAAVDPTGAFGSDLFYEAPEAFTQNGELIPPAIYRVDGTGTESIFTSPEFGEMRFGPGGAWGSNLYVAGVVIDPGGIASAFPADFGEFDWAPGPGFDGDMFGTLDGADAGEIYRIRPDGTATLFATGPASSIAGCNGALWLANSDGCDVIERRGNR